MEFSSVGYCVCCRLAGSHGSNKGGGDCRAGQGWAEVLASLVRLRRGEDITTISF